MKKYNVVDYIFDFRNCSEELKLEIQGFVADQEMGQYSYVTLEPEYLEELEEEYPLLVAHIKNLVGDDPDPAMLKVWW